MPLEVWDGDLRAIAPLFVFSPSCDVTAADTRKPARAELRDASDTTHEGTGPTSPVFFMQSGTSSASKKSFVIPTGGRNLPLKCRMCHCAEQQVPHG
jgi:hypothetical protein